MVFSYKDDSPSSSYSDEKVAGAVDDDIWTGLTRRTKSIPETKVSKQGQRNNTSDSMIPQGKTVRSFSDNKYKKKESFTVQRGFEALTSKLYFWTDTLGNAIEEGLNLVEAKATDLIHMEPRNRIFKKNIDLMSPRERTLNTSISQRRLEDKTNISEKKVLGDANRQYNLDDKRFVTTSKTERRIREKPDMDNQSKLMLSEDVRPNLVDTSSMCKEAQNKIKSKSDILASEKHVISTVKLCENIDEKAHVTGISVSSGSKVQIKSDEKTEQIIFPRKQSSGDLRPGPTKDTQLKASRDVAMAMTTKAKLLLRELKGVKTDIAFTNQRCTQLEEENKRLKENIHKGPRHEDDDLVRLQLESLLAEKGRLAQENADYARENQFLHQLLEYHRLKLRNMLHPDENMVVDGEYTEPSNVDMDNLPLYPEEKDIIALEESVKIANQQSGV